MSSIQFLHEVKDWNARKENKYGCFELIEALEREIVEGDFADALVKINSCLQGDGYFAPAFVKSKLPELLVGMLPGVTEEATRGARENKTCEPTITVSYVLARGCRFHKTVLDKICGDYFPEIFQSLQFQTDENLYTIIDAMSRSSRWLRFLRAQADLLHDLAQPKTRRYCVLERVPEEAIEHGVVDLCLNELGDESSSQIGPALRCLLAMTFYPKGRSQALEFGCLKALLDILSDPRHPAGIKAPAVGCLTNLLEDPTHAAKKQAIELDGGQVLNRLLLTSGYEKDKLKKDLVLFTLQAIAIYAADPSARNSYQDSDALQSIHGLTNSSCDLVARTATRTLAVLHWRP